MEFNISTRKKKEIVDITDLINDKISKSTITDGLCVLFAKHTTACITTADLDPGTDEDMLDAFEAMMPKLNYRHPHNPAHVTDHILSSIIGASVSVPIKNGRFDLGTWQRVILIELDGPRERKIVVNFFTAER